MRHAAQVWRFESLPTVAWLMHAQTTGAVVRGANRLAVIVLVSGSFDVHPNEVTSWCSRLQCYCFVRDILALIYFLMRLAMDFNSFFVFCMCSCFTHSFCARSRHQAWPKAVCVCTCAPSRCEFVFCTVKWPSHLLVL